MSPEPRLPFTTAAERRVATFSLTGAWLGLAGLLALLVTRLMNVDGATSALVIDGYLAGVILTLIAMLGSTTIRLLRANQAPAAPRPARAVAVIPAPPVVDPPLARPAAPVAEPSAAPARSASIPMRDAPGFTPAVFISHSKHDNTFGLALAERLAAALQPAGTVWYDACGDPQAQCAGLRPGESWWEGIQRELTERNVFVLILTPEALDSSWVKQEIETAHTQMKTAVGKALIPVFLADPSTLRAPPFIAGIQGVTFYDRPYDTAFAELLAAVKLGYTRFKDDKPASERLGPPFILADLPQVEHLIGRDPELERVLEALRGPAGTNGGLASVFAASGFPGIGKSALAGKAALALREEGAFPGGIVAISCKNEDKALPLLRQVIAAFDPVGREPDTTSLPALTRLLNATFANIHALVILDNIEPQLLPPELSTLVGALRDAGAAVLLTSRQELLSPSIPAGARIQLHLLSPEAALALFALYYLLVGEMSLSAEQETQAARIVKKLGFHTLAVKLAAGLARKRDLAAYAQELENDPRLAMGLTQGDESVKVVLESSYGALPAEAQRLFTALAAFATGDIGRDATLALGAALLGDDDTARTALQTLEERSLVDAVTDDAMPEESDRERMQLHPLIVTFINQRFGEWNIDDRMAAQAAVAAWYAVYAGEQRRHFSALSADEANIIGALEWAHERGEDQLVSRLCVGMRTFWRDTGRTRAGLAYLLWGIDAAERVASASGERDDRLRAAEIALSYGDLLYLSGRLGEAQQNYEKGLIIRRAIADRRGEGMALSGLGRVAESRGQYDEAEQYFQQALGVDRELHNLSDEAADTAWLGQLAMNRGQLDGAESYFLAALEMHTEIGDRSEISKRFTNLGQVAQARGQLEVAEEYYKDSLTIKREVQDRRGEGVVLSSLGQIAQQRGRPGEASDYFQQSLVIDREVQDRRGEGVDLSNLGQIELQRGRLEEASDYFQQSLVIDREVQDRQGEGVVLSSLGQIELRRGRLEEASAYFQQSLVIRREVQDRQGEGVVLSNLGQIELRRGRLEEASDYFQQGLVVLREVQDRRGEGVVLSFLGKIEMQEEDWQLAERYTRESLAIDRETENRQSEGVNLAQLGYIAEAQGRDDEAERNDREALAVLADAQDFPNYASVSAAFGRFLIESERNRGEGCQMLAEAVRLYDQMGIPGADEARETARRLGCG